MALALNPVSMIGLALILTGGVKCRTCWKRKLIPVASPAGQALVASLGAALPPTGT